MKKTKKKANNHSLLILMIILTIIVLLSIIVVSLNSNNNQENGATGSGKEFSFTLLDGTEGQLSNYRGKIVILDMWATWCGYCTPQMTELSYAYDEYSRTDLEIISLNVDTRENAQMVYDYIEEFKNQYDIELNWIFGLDDGTVWQEYMIGGGIPTLYIFDQQGNIHYSHEGLSYYTQFKAKIDELL